MAVAPSGFRASLVTDRVRRSTLRGRGLRFRLRCSAACAARVVLRVDAMTAKRLGRSSRIVGTATLRRAGAGRSTATLKVPRVLARRLTARPGAALRLEAAVREPGVARRGSGGASSSPAADQPQNAMSSRARPTGSS